MSEFGVGWVNSFGDLILFTFPVNSKNTLTFGGSFSLSSLFFPQTSRIRRLLAVHRPFASLTRVDLSTFPPTLIYPCLNLKERSFKPVWMSFERTLNKFEKVVNKPEKTTSPE